MKVEYHREENATWLDLIPETLGEAINLGVVYGEAATDGCVVRREGEAELRLSLVRCLSGAERPVVD